jgi:prepilin-type N-terminal cleavage/methylation domain-containing protein
MGADCAYKRRDGFTLIELSIVLVIIGLIVGGILVGQSLISAAGVRAQVTQIEKYNTAANTFREKYGYLPGDIPPAQVTQFGFTVVPTRAGTQGRGDGNGVIEGYNYQGAEIFDISTSGETAFFWEDLSANSHLIEGTFSAAVDAEESTNTALLIPQAKLGNGNFVYVYAANGTNYFGLSNVANTIGAAGVISATGNSPGLTVLQAYAIDTKVDDGFPQTGNVKANYQNWNLFASYVNGAVWAAGGGAAGVSGTAATAGSSTTCYDNSNTSAGTPGVSGATQHYSIEMNNGANNNCALSFKMQAGD